MPDLRKDGAQHFAEQFADTIALALGRLGKATSTTIDLIDDQLQPAQHSGGDA